jgi:hypothetical protein
VFIDRGWLLVAVFTVASAPYGRYVVSADTIADTKTGLTWQRAVPAGTFTQADGAAQCQSLALGGFSSGWRLPAKKELDSIVDPVGYGPAVDPNAFPGTPNQFFWSSSSSSNGNGWYVDFTNGADSTAAPSQSFRIRCVH